ncbi:MAG TPA: hypothetical protein VFE13_13935 [Caulobacteraceae bacterium]|nr:hypothetical protein [Caulobacteraceae bacterium]
MLAPDIVVMIYLGLVAAAAGALGLRALFLGVCEHLEADDIPSTARDQAQAETLRRAPAAAVSRPIHRFPASAMRRASAYPRLPMSAHR